MSNIKNMDEGKGAIYFYYLASNLLAGFLFVTVPPYLKQIGFSAFNYGLFGSISTFSGILALILGGFLCDKWKASYVIAVGQGIRIAYVAMLMTKSPIAVYFAGALFGISASFSVNSFQVFLSRAYSEEVYHYVFPYTSAVANFGIGIGSYLGFLPKFLPFGTVKSLQVSILAISLLLIPISISAIMAASRLERGGERRRKLEKIPRENLSDFLKLGIYNLIIGFGASMSIWNASYYFMLKYHVGSASLGIYYGTESMAMALLSLALPKLSERLGSSLKVYLLFSYLSLPFLLGITFVNNYYLAVAILIVRYILMNVANPLFSAFIMKIFPERVRGRAYSITSMMFSVGAVPGQSVGGYLLQVNLEMPFRITSGIYLLGMSLLYLWYYRRRDRK